MNKINLQVDQFLIWYQSKIASKYNPALEGLRKRFLGLFNLFGIILTSTIKILELLPSDKSGEDSLARPLLDNIIHILNMTIMEYPEVLDL